MNPSSTHPEQPISKVNLAMLSRIAAVLELSVEMPPKLSKILSQGFLEFEGHCFLKFHQTRINKSDFAGMIERLHDSTGVECWVNDVSIVPCAYGAHLQIGLIFAAKLIQKWKRSKLYRPAVVLVSSNDALTSIRFHLKRNNQSWFEENLEGYGFSGILIMEV